MDSGERLSGDGSLDIYPDDRLTSFYSCPARVENPLEPAYGVAIDAEERFEPKGMLPADALESAIIGTLPLDDPPVISHVD